MGRRPCPEIVGETARQVTKAREIPELLGVLGEWERAMESGSVHGVLATLSAGFRSTLWSGRLDLERSLSAGGVAVDIEDIHIRSAGWDVGAVVRVENAKIGSGPDPTVLMQVVREESDWKILSIEQQN